ncbi:hypothetical protein ACFQKF_13820 [Halalkalicoccus sp. GCM10025322]|uniref:hypothetical protein n=1 Tax=Halalkalicoccus TaxID=332246 RepID=UPI002F96E90B
MVGEEMMGLYAVRTASVFANPNTYGFFMMIGRRRQVHGGLGNSRSVQVQTFD